MESSARAPHGSEPWERGDRRPRGPRPAPGFLGWTAPDRHPCAMMMRLTKDFIERSRPWKGYAHWHGRVQAFLSASWRRRERTGGAASPVDARPGAAFLREAAGDGGGDGGVRGGATLGRADAAWARGAVDRATACQALRGARQERCGRCGGAVRGGKPPHIRFAPAKTAYAQSPGAPQSQPFALHATLRCDTP